MISIALSKFSFFFLGKKTSVKDIRHQAITIPLLDNGISVRSGLAGSFAALRICRPMLLYGCAIGHQQVNEHIWQPLSFDLAICRVLSAKNLEPKKKKKGHGNIPGKVESPAHSTLHERGWSYA